MKIQSACKSLHAEMLTDRRAYEFYRCIFLNTLLRR